MKLSAFALIALSSMTVASAQIAVPRLQFEGKNVVVPSAGFRQILDNLGNLWLVAQTSNGPVVSRYDRSGKLIFETVVSSEAGSTFRGVALQPFGGVILVGDTPDDQGFIVRVSATGAIQRRTRIKIGGFATHVRCVDIGENGTVVVGGQVLNSHGNWGAVWSTLDRYDAPLKYQYYYDASRTDHVRALPDGTVMGEVLYGTPGDAVVFRSDFASLFKNALYSTGGNAVETITSLAVGSDGNVFLGGQAIVGNRSTPLMITFNSNDGSGWWETRENVADLQAGESGDADTVLLTSGRAIWGLGFNGVYSNGTPRVAAKELYRNNGAAPQYFTELSDSVEPSEGPIRMAQLPGVLLAADAKGRILSYPDALDTASSLPYRYPNVMTSPWKGRPELYAPTSVAAPQIAAGEGQIWVTGIDSRNRLTTTLALWTPGPEQEFTVAEDTPLVANVRTNLANFGYLGAPSVYDVVAGSLQGPVGDFKMGTLTTPGLFLPNGEFHFTPQPNTNGIVRFKYRVLSGGLNDDAVTITIRVLPVNDPPTAVNDTLTASAIGWTTLDVLSNDTDPDGHDTLSVASVTAPAMGQAKPSADKKGVNYRPNKGFHGTDTFTYTIRDEKKVTSTATVTVTVP